MPELARQESRSSTTGSPACAAASAASRSSASCSPPPTSTRCCTCPAPCPPRSRAAASSPRSSSGCPQAERRYRHYLPLFPAAMRGFDLAGLRPRALLQPRGGQERARARGGAPRLLLLHPDALRVGPLRRLLRPAGRPGRAAPHAAGGGVAAPLGPAHRGGRAPLRGHLALRGRPHPPRLRPRRRRDLPAGGRRALPRRRVAGRVLPGGLGADAVQAGGPGGGGVQPARAAPRRGGHRAGGRGGCAPWPGPPWSSSAGATTRETAELYARCRALLFPTARGLRHHAARGDGGGTAGHRLGQGGALETVVPPGSGRAADRPLLRAPDGGGSRRTPSGASSPARVRFEPKALRRRAEAFDRPLFKERIERVPARARSRGTRRAEGLLAAARAGDAGGRPRCWSRAAGSLAYAVRFYVAGPPLPQQGIPPLDAATC